MFLLFLIAFLVFLPAGMLFFLGRFHKNPGGTTGVVPLIFQWYPFSGTLGDPLNVWMADGAAAYAGFSGD